MKAKWLWGLAAVAVVAFLAGTAIAEVGYQIRVNGRLVPSEVAPQNINGRLLVPLRTVAEALGADVSYDAATRTAVIQTSTAKKALGTGVKNAYLSIALDINAPAGTIWEILKSPEMDRYDGLEVVTGSVVTSIAGIHIRAWRSGLLTTDEFILKWQSLILGTPAGGATASSSSYGLSTSGVYAGGSTGHWVRSVTERGRYVKLEDGSLWEVNPIDRIDSLLWLITEEIVVVASDNPLYPYRLINKDADDAVEAKLLSK